MCGAIQNENRRGAWHARHAASSWVDRGHRCRRNGKSGSSVEKKLRQPRKRLPDYVLPCSFPLRTMGRWKWRWSAAGGRARKRGSVAAAARDDRRAVTNEQAASKCHAVARRVSVARLNRFLLVDAKAVPIGCRQRGIVDNVARFIYCLRSFARVSRRLTEIQCWSEDIFNFLCFKGISEYKKKRWGILKYIWCRKKSFPLPSWVPLVYTAITGIFWKACYLKLSSVKIVYLMLLAFTVFSGST